MQTRAKILMYAEGEIEVRKVLEGLDDDLNRMTVKPISDFPWHA